MPIVTKHNWPDNVTIWTLDSHALTEPVFFNSAQSVATYLFENGLSATWTTIQHDH